MQHPRVQGPGPAFMPDPVVQPEPVIEWVTRYNYSVVPGVFIQDDPFVDPVTLGAVPPRFGLIDSSDARWRNLQTRVNNLNNAESDEGVKYKVLFLARHGQGYHNLGEEIHGDEGWDRYWATQNGDGSHVLEIAQTDTNIGIKIVRTPLIWGPDAKLSHMGKGQVRAVHAMWKNEIKKPYEIPRPTLYSSPLSRAADTLRITFTDPRKNIWSLPGDIWPVPQGPWSVPEGPWPAPQGPLPVPIGPWPVPKGPQPVPENIWPVPPGQHNRPLIVEDFREWIGVFTCDKRNNRAYIEKRFPGYKFEEGFTDEDELWTIYRREHDKIQGLRARVALDRILDKDASNFVSITCHGGTVSNLLIELGHREYDLPTSGVVPVLIRAYPKREVWRLLNGRELWHLVDGRWRPANDAARDPEAVPPTDE